MIEYMNCHHDMDVKCDICGYTPPLPELAMRSRAHLDLQNGDHNNGQEDEQKDELNVKELDVSQLVTQLPHELSGISSSFVGPNVVMASQTLSSVSDVRHDYLASDLPYQQRIKIAQGTMGIVFKAFDPVLQRPVALKTITTFAHGTHLIEAVLAEARMASALQHRNIVTVFNVHCDQHVPCIVTEWVDGETLEKRLQCHDLSLKQKLTIANDIVSALLYAHSQGISHGDIKPSNIMLTEQDCTVKMLDFGLARRSPKVNTSTTQTVVTPADLPMMLPVAHSASTERASKNTYETVSSHRPAGTLAYMAPECLRGMTYDAFKADWFSVGVVLWQLFYERHPFLQADTKATLQAVLEHSPQPPTTPRHKVPTAVHDILLQLLEKQPQQRAPSILAILDTFQSAINELDVKTRWGIYYPIRQTKVWFSLVLMLVFASIFLGQQLVSRDDLLAKGRTIAILPFENSAADPSVALMVQGIGFSLSHDLTVLGPYNNSPWVVSASELANVAEQNVRQLHLQYDADLVIKGHIIHLGQTRRVQLSLLDAVHAKQIKSLEFDVSLMAWDDLHQQIRQQLLMLLDWEMPAGVEPQLSQGPRSTDQAYSLYLTGLSYLYRYDSKRNLTEAMKMFEQALLMSPRFDAARIELIHAYLMQSRSVDPAPWLAKVEAQLSQLADQTSIAVMFVRAQLYHFKGQYSEAIQLAQQILQRDPRYARAYFVQAESYQALGNLTAAEQTYIASLAEQDSWIVRNYLATFYMQTNQLEKAMRTYEQLSKMSPNNSTVLQTLGAIQFSQLKLDAALSAFEKAARLEPSADNFSNIGSIYFYQRNYQAAIDAYLQAVSFADASFVVWANLGDAYRWAAHTDAAQQSYLKAISLLEPRLQQGNNPRLLLRKALYQAKAGDTQAAWALVEQLPAFSESRFILMAAQIAEIAGHRERALQYIQQALKLGVALDSLTQEPEFSKLLQAHPELITK